MTVLSAAARRSIPYTVVLDANLLLTRFIWLCVLSLGVLRSMIPCKMSETLNVSLTAQSGGI